MKDEGLGQLLGLVVVALIVLLIDLALFIAWALRKDDVDAGRRPPIFARKWSLIDVWISGQLVVALTLGAALLIVVIGFFVWGTKSVSLLDPSRGPMMLWLLGTSGVIQNALCVAIPAGFLIWKYRVSIASIGLRWPPTGREIVIGVVAGIAMLLLSGVVEGCLKGAIWLVFGPATLHALEELTSRLTMDSMLTHGMTRSMFITLFVIGAIAAPIGEEFFFRGFLYNAAKARFGMRWGIALSASIFALIHLGPLVVIPIFFMGAVLAYMYERTGSLWVTIVMHSVTNGVQIVAAYVFAGR